MGERFRKTSQLEEAITRRLHSHQRRFILLGAMIISGSATHRELLDVLCQLIQLGLHFTHGFLFFFLTPFRQEDELCTVILLLAHQQVPNELSSRVRYGVRQFPIRLRGFRGWQVRLGLEPPLMHLHLFTSLSTSSTPGCISRPEAEPEGARNTALIASAAAAGSNDSESCLPADIGVSPEDIASKDEKRKRE